MSNFPGNNDDLDTFAFRAATEAVVGLISAGKAVNQKSVHDWIVKALGDTDPSIQVRARAMYFAERMEKGPWPPDAPAGHR